MKQGFKLVWLLIVLSMGSVLFAQVVPTPCGTPIADTCLSWGAGEAMVIDVGGWGGADGIAFILSPPSSAHAIQVTQLDLAAIPKTGALAYDLIYITVFEILNPSLLPDIEAAGVSRAWRLPYAIGTDSAPDPLVFFRFDLLGDYDPIICNPNPIAIRIEYDYNETGAIDWDFVVDSPTCDFVPSANIHYDFGTDAYTWIENNPITDGNWAGIIRYFSNASPIVPAAGPMGIILLILGISAFILPRRK